MILKSNKNYKEITKMDTKDTEINNKKIEHYEIIMSPSGLLGHGTYGDVRLAIDHSTGKEVAVKMIPLSKLYGQGTACKREVDVMKQLKGPHIIELIDTWQTQNNLYIFIELCESGDLESKIRKKKDSQEEPWEYTEEEVLRIIKQIASVFVSIAEMKIVNENNQLITFMHRDIKPSNIMLVKGKKDIIKLGDFGFAKIIEEIEHEDKKNHTIVGTPLYMSPEILNEEKYSAKCDVWSTGILFYELLFKKVPWIGISKSDLLGNIKTQDLEIPSKINETTEDLLRKMLTFKDEERISWKEVYEHPALREITISY